MSELSLPPFVGVVTFNPMATMRFELLEQTVRSIEKAFPTGELFLLDNLSDDGSWEAVCEMLGTEGSKCAECDAPMRGRWHAANRSVWHPPFDDGPPDDNRTPGAGRARLLNVMMHHIPDEGHEAVVDHGLAGGEEPVDHLPRYYVWSDDDMEWREGAQAKLTHFWSDPPEGVRIVSGLLEPVWHWNTPRRTVEGGGVKVLVRDSAPGAAWTFQRPPFNLLRPGTVKEQGDELWRFGYDYELSKMLREQGVEVAQIDLAEHRGWGASTHGNEAIEAPETKPLDRDKWGV